MKLKLCYLRGKCPLFKGYIKWFCPLKYCAQIYLIFPPKKNNPVSFLRIILGVHLGLLGCRKVNVLESNSFLSVIAWLRLFKVGEREGEREKEKERERQRERKRGSVLSSFCPGFLLLGFSSCAALDRLVGSAWSCHGSASLDWAWLGLGFSSCLHWPPFVEINWVCTF